MKRRAIIAGAVVLGLLLLGYLLYRPVLNGLAQYLVYPDRVAPSDAIVLLGGETDGQRTRKAVELYRAGMAPKIVVSSGAQISWRTTESKEMVALLRQLQVPASAIVLETRSLSTYDNAVYTRQLLEGEKLEQKRITLVTDDWHTRRAVFIFERVFQGSGIEIASAGSHSLKKIHLEQWWQDHESIQTILSEWARYIVYRIKY